MPECGPEWFPEDIRNRRGARPLVKGMHPPPLETVLAMRLDNACDRPRRSGIKGSVVVEDE